QCGADLVLGLADEGAEDLADVEAQQRHLPHGADGLGREALTAAGDADEQDALGHREPELAGLRVEGVLALGEPLLEDLEAADVAEVLLRLEVLEDSGLADDALLLAEDDVDIEVAGPDDALGEDVLGLVEGEAEG